LIGDNYFELDIGLINCIVDLCPMQDTETNKTYLTDVFGNWTIIQACLSEFITIIEVKCLANGTWSNNILCPGNNN